VSATGVIGCHAHGFAWRPGRKHAHAKPWAWHPAIAVGLLLVVGSRAAPPDDTQTLPIDLPTALRLVETANPTVAAARARVAAAYAQLDQAKLLWLPNLQSGTTYVRHDGWTQNQRGEVFNSSRSSLFLGNAVTARVDTADAYFLPLVGRRLANAAAANARATANNIQLDVAFAYLDLLQVHAALAINADTLARDTEMLRRAEAAERAGLAKTTADANRARTEVNLRRQEALDFQGRAAVVSARLAQLLLLQPTVDLVPADPAVVPITLVPDAPLADLVATATANRPEMAAARATSGAAQERVRQAQVAPFLPRLEVGYSGGAFGAGMNDNLTFHSRGDALAQATWELRNLGFGNRAQVREREALATEAGARIVEAQALVGAEVSAAAKQARARLLTLTAAQDAVREALEMYRRLEASSFGMAGPRAQYDALEPLLAIQALNQARVQFLTEVIEYNRAQFRLYTALGQPALCALPGSALPLDVPPTPPAERPSEPRP
jgi:outer membrane protein TolC